MTLLRENASDCTENRNVILKRAKRGVELKGEGREETEKREWKSTSFRDGRERRWRAATSSWSQLPLLVRRFVLAPRERKRRKRGEKKRKRGRKKRERRQEGRRRREEARATARGEPGSSAPTPRSDFVRASAPGRTTTRERSATAQRQQNGRALYLPGASPAAQPDGPPAANEQTHDADPDRARATAEDVCEGRVSRVPGTT